MHLSRVLGVFWITWLLTEQHAHCQAFRWSILDILTFPFLAWKREIRSIDVLFNTTTYDCGRFGLFVLLSLSLSDDSAEFSIGEVWCDDTEKKSDSESDSEDAEKKSDSESDSGDAEKKSDSDSDSDKVEDSKVTRRWRAMMRDEWKLTLESMEVTEHCSTCTMDEGILITACMHVVSTPCSADVNRTEATRRISSHS